MRIKILAGLVLVLALCSTFSAQQRAQGRITVSASTCATAGACVQLPLGQNAGSVGISITGTFTGTITFETSADGSNYDTAPFCFDTTGTAAQSTTTTGTFVCSAAGFVGFQARGSATITGTALITLSVGNGSIGGGGGGGGGAVTCGGAACATEAKQDDLITLLQTPTGPQTPENANAVTIMGSATWQANITSSMNQTVTTALIAGTASNYTYVRACSFSNNHASVDTLMYLRDSSTGNTLWVVTVPHGLGNNVYWPAESPLKVPTLAAGLSVSNATTGSSTYAACGGFKSTTSF